MAALRFFFYLLMKPAALGMAILGITGIFAPFVSPEKWWVPAFSGLFMPLIIIANIFLLIFWGLHKRWWVLLPLLTLAGNYYYFSSMYQMPWKKKELCQTDKEIIVATYNVEGFYWITHKQERKVFQEFVRDNHIDILCIQEHCEELNLDTATIRERISLPYRTVFFNHKTPWANFGMSIYSRYPILRQGDIDFNSEKNSSMWADILIGQDTIRIFNNHLQTTDVSINRQQYNKYRSVKDWKGQARTLVNLLEQLKYNFIIRARQAEQVRQVIDTTPYPVIVTGDFNDTPISYAYNHVTDNLFKDGFMDCGYGYGHSFNGLKGLLRIDFVAYTHEFCGKEYVSPHLDWSDHNPVILKLGLSGRFL